MRWWKILSIVLLFYTFIAGFIITVPDIGNLQQTIRNLFFHVPMWFGQLTLITVSLVYSILYLRKPERRFDVIAVEYAKTGIVFGILGLVTGAIWANYTWGAAWSNDPKQLGMEVMGNTMPFTGILSLNGPFLISLIVIRSVFTFSLLLPDVK